MNKHIKDLLLDDIRYDSSYLEEMLTKYVHGEISSERFQFEFQVIELRHKLRNQKIELYELE